MKRLATVRPESDRNVRIVLGVAAALFITGPILLIGNSLSNSRPGNGVVASGQPGYDHLVSLRNGATMLLGQGSFSARIAQWLALNTDEQSAFEIADANFVTGSDEPTVEGRRQVSQIAQVLKADHQLRAQVIVTNGSSDEDSALQLARARALRIGKELLAQRAPAENLSVLAQPLSEVQAKHIFEDPGQRSELFVVLSR